MSTRAGVRRTAAALAVIAACVLAAGCGGEEGAASGAKTPQTLRVTLTDAGCSPAKLRASAGSITFEITNGGTAKVSEAEVKNGDGIILGESENIVSGIDGSFTLDLQPGRYVLSILSEPNSAMMSGQTVIGIVVQ